ncbi:MAG: Fis family transcriptional regulator [Variovorax paradoxus]|uniref:Fis family transcriptional regulator n=1 Tax=Variovorax paradoxus TaxID=34073 RepID=A0A2W5QDN2_VARPD|nr:MAG: Fis family transcriptional regulator [Variovorax paradoxus]
MTHALRSGAHAPRQLFATTPAQRVAMARQQFFEEGLRPSGLVGEAVIQSWMRCRRTHADTRQPVAFDPVTRSRLHSALGRNRELMAAAQADLLAMEAALAGTDCRVLLTDCDGVMLHVTHHPMAPRQPVLHRTARVGVNIAEHVVGTTAPGIVASTGQACTVSGAEHYFDLLREVHCAAAPIRDVRGRLAGVLDLSVEGQRFGFDAGSMVGLYATTIENRLLQAQSGAHLVLRFQASPALLGTPLEALAGIAADGTVAWLNDAGARLIGRLPAQAVGRRVDELLGHDLPSLLRLGRREAAQPMRLASGLGVWMQARLHAADGIDFRHAVATLPMAAADRRAPPHDTVPPAAGKAPAAVDASPLAAPPTPGQTLRQQERLLVQQALAAHHGNVSSAARALGVSRGTLYRRLRAVEND